MPSCKPTRQTILSGPERGVVTGHTASLRSPGSSGGNPGRASACKLAGVVYASPGQMRAHPLVRARGDSPHARAGATCRGGVAVDSKIARERDESSERLLGHLDLREIQGQWQPTGAEGRGDKRVTRTGFGILKSHDSKVETVLIERTWTSPWSHQTLVCPPFRTIPHLIGEYKWGLYRCYPRA